VWAQRNNRGIKISKSPAGNLSYLFYFNFFRLILILNAYLCLILNKECRQVFPSRFFPSNYWWQSSVPQCIFFTILIVSDTRNNKKTLFSRNKIVLINKLLACWYVFLTQIVLQISYNGVGDFSSRWAFTSSAKPAHRPIRVPSRRRWGDSIGRNR